MLTTRIGSRPLNVTTAGSSPTIAPPDCPLLVPFPRSDRHCYYVNKRSWQLKDIVWVFASIDWQYGLTIVKRQYKHIKSTIALKIIVLLASLKFFNPGKIPECSWKNNVTFNALYGMQDCRSVMEGISLVVSGFIVCEIHNSPVLISLITITVKKHFRPVYSGQTAFSWQIGDSRRGLRLQRRISPVK